MSNLEGFYGWELREGDSIILNGEENACKRIATMLNKQRANLDALDDEHHKTKLELGRAIVERDAALCQVAGTDRKLNKMAQKCREANVVIHRQKKDQKAKHEDCEFLENALRMLASNTWENWKACLGLGAGELVKLIDISQYAQRILDELKTRGETDEVPF
jgi:DNA repair ATPase RecN